MLQRRLASSPEAILRSLERRQVRLETRLREWQRATDEARYSTSMTASIDEWSTGRVALDFEDASASAPSFNPDEFDDLDEEISEEERAQFEARVDQVVDLATAAESIGELRAEIAILEDLIRVARRVRLLDDDKKWVELRTILDDQLAEVLQTHSPVNMRVRAVSVYSHLWTVTLPTVRPFSTNSCASRSVVGEIGASVVVAVVRMRP